MSEVQQVKIAFYGNAEVGKTSLINRYLSGELTHNYLETLGTGFREKEIVLQGQKIMLCLWDIGGEEQFQQMIPLSAEGAHILLFLFDLTQKESLAGIKNWYKNVRKINQHAIAFLIGAKYDLFELKLEQERQEVIQYARKYAKAMSNAPLIFTSSSKGTNINRLFKFTIIKAFGLQNNIEACSDQQQPLFEFIQ